ncbi:beta-eliminating lyase-related protein [Rhizobium sp. RCAM05973]|uniref:threonine aldolase family protein n=1 Tax=Rhizobium sp. RCAM05973 TaxID=2994066 RepID=UPI0022EC1491|nr:beta-eliminating lyase-related protein [Rhizobium sp. RCAM05973]
MDNGMANVAGEWNFASDNVTGVSPEIMQALLECNRGNVGSYGFDALTERLTERLCEVFETELIAFPVATGTAANALALSVLTAPYRSIICAQDAHINTDECGAPEFFTGGAKLLALSAPGGKLIPHNVEAAFERARAEGFQTAQPVTLSISQATEWGLTYSAEEVRDLAGLAKRYGASLHMDGARFANALVRAGESPADVTWRVGVDALSLGATKNGALAAEILVLFDTARRDAAAAQRKRSGHLWSKSRFLSAQLLAYLEDDLWLRNASHANAMATRLGEGLAAIPLVELVHPVQANEVFVRMPPGVADRFSASGVRFAKWTRGPKSDNPIFRFVTSFNTQEKAVDDLVSCGKA